MTDLDKLIEAVEGVVLNAHIASPYSLARALKCCVLDEKLYMIPSAYHGSLDAAKALHEALLPGWGVEIAVSGDHSSALVFLDGYRDDYSEKWETLQGGSIARAWLLATLKAYRAQEQA